MDDSPPKRHKPPTTEQNLKVDIGGDQDDDKEDRISNLPDEILCHILSKLPTKHAVATAALSTKWKHLFPTIPNLCLRLDDSDHGESSPVSHRTTNFTNFMHNLLTNTLRDVRIRKFHLRCYQNYENAHVNAWVSAVLGLNVTFISLVFDSKNTGVSIDGIFNCNTLEYLFWTQHCVLNVPISVYLPNLKRLYLEGVKFVDGDAVDRVLEGCPVLKELSLDSCEFEDIEYLCISSPSLKCLLLYNCYQENMYEVQIDTPSLEFLYYDDHVAELYTVSNLSSLQTAHIDIGTSDQQVEDADDEDLTQYDQNVVDLVTACCNVDFLYLSRSSVSSIYWSSCPVPTFHNLTELSLGDLNIPGWELLPRFLESAPNLKILFFMGGFCEFRKCYAKFQSALPDCVPACLSLHLQRICFEEFNGEEDEFNLVEYFLKTAVVLRKMKFSFRSSLPPEKQFCSWSKLLSLQRFSSTCQIEFANAVKKTVVYFCLGHDSDEEIERT
ncbi:F-box/LRR-repeat protein At4g14103-like [Actinidia eriantha]|uniref:F-box/LRR-repeat protein At4g14103-like n=1 Tax=Actinidia eriantha TaxID=165200 RepID=UPI002588052C|nr:F-box/LRR-repeat protein At4g14103-like [Actinidia eriantha]